MKYATGYHDAKAGRAMVARHGEEYALGYRQALREMAAAENEHWAVLESLYGFDDHGWR